MKTILSGVGVIDKSMLILAALEQGPLSLTQLVEQTDLNRATTHRLALALDQHGLLRRVDTTRFALGFRLWILGQAVPGAASLATRVQPHLDRLRDRTGESAQLYVRDGNERVCLATAESEQSLRTIVPVGTRLTLERGSAGAIFMQDNPSSGWVASVAERESGVASVSSAVLDQNGETLAVVSVSGPIERLSTDPGALHGQAVADIAIVIAASVS